jgi:hypothetical protein
MHVHSQEYALWMEYKCTYIIILDATDLYILSLINDGRYLRSIFGL